eukprot:RCo039596
MLGCPLVLRIFAAHVSVAQAHPKLVTIPLGQKKEWVDGLQSVRKSAASGRPPKELIFAKFAVKRPPLRVQRRMEAVRVLRALGWGSLSSATRKVTPAEFYSQLARSRFVLSPPGNGLDTYRTWEALALGRCPVVLAGQLHQEDTLFGGLPVVSVR